MKVLQENLIVVVDDHNKMIAVGRRNGHLEFHKTPVMTVDQMVMFLEQLSKKEEIKKLIVTT